MHDSSDFLADIRAAPDDDTPRLVYADWLEERGETSRAELIRVQCQLSRLPWYDDRHNALVKRETKLFRQHKDQWLGDFKSMVFSARFERGFVESVALGARQFEKHAEQIFSRAPVTKVSLTQVSDKAAEAVAEMPSLSMIRQLVISGSRMTDAGWQRLLTSTHLNGLQSLEISVDFESGRTTASHVLAALAQCPSLPGLERLGSSLLHVDDQPAQRAFQSLSMPSLRSLSLPNARADVLQIICPMSIAPRLVELDVSGNDLRRTRSLRLLGESASALVNLRIKGCHVSDRSVRELHSLPCLADLDIGFNEISDRGLVMLMTRLPRLKRLDARHNRVSGTGLGSLLKTETVAPLEEFATTSERLDSGGVLALASRLRPVRLTLSETGLTDDTVELLLNTANMGCLRWLDLSNNSLTDQTAEAIIKSPYLNNLRFLSLQENVISPEMKKALRNKYGPGVCTFSR